MTTTRAILVITSSPAASITTVAASGLGWPARQQTSRLDARLTRNLRQDCHRTVIQPVHYRARHHAPSGRMRPATTSSASSDSAASAWFSRPSSSRNSLPAGVAGTTPSPVSSLTATTQAPVCRHAPTSSAILPASFSRARAAARAVPGAALVQGRGQPGADPVDQQRPAGGAEQAGQVGGLGRPPPGRPGAPGARPPAPPSPGHPLRVVPWPRRSPPARPPAATRPAPTCRNVPRPAQAPAGFRPGRSEPFRIRTGRADRLSVTDEPYPPEPAAPCEFPLRGHAVIRERHRRDRARADQAPGSQPAELGGIAQQVEERDVVRRRALRRRRHRPRSPRIEQPPPVRRGDIPSPGSPLPQVSQPPHAVTRAPRPRPPRPRPPRPRPPRPPRAPGPQPHHPVDDYGRARSRVIPSVARRRQEAHRQPGSGQPALPPEPSTRTRISPGRTAGPGGPGCPRSGRPGRWTARCRGPAGRRSPGRSRTAGRRPAGRATGRARGIRARAASARRRAAGRERVARRSSSLRAPSSISAMPAVACGTKTCSRPSPPSAAALANSEHSPVMSLIVSRPPVRTSMICVFMPWIIGCR